MAEGEPAEPWFYRVERPLRSVPRDKREPQAGPASCLSNSASKLQIASGDGVCLPEPKTERPVHGEGLQGWPGSKSVASAEGSARNRGDLELSRRTNCASPAGMPFQRQGEAEAVRGVGSTRGRSWQGASPEMAEGADNLTKSTQATSSVRTTEPHWQTFLWATSFTLWEFPGARAETAVSSLAALSPSGTRGRAATHRSGSPGLSAS